MMHFKNERDAAAYLIRMGRQLRESNLPLSEFVNRRDNNRNSEYGYTLIEMGRRAAMGYAFGDQPITREIYLAHIRATRPGRR